MRRLQPGLLPERLQCHRLRALHFRLLRRGVRCGSEPCGRRTRIDRGRVRAGRTNCTVCPPGRFNPSDALSACQLCAQGKFTQAFGQTVCENCPRGRFRCGARRRAAPILVLTGDTLAQYCPGSEQRPNAVHVSAAPMLDCAPRLTTAGRSNCTAGRYAGSDGLSAVRGAAAPACRCALVISARLASHAVLSMRPRNLLGHKRLDRVHVVREGPRPRRRRRHVLLSYAHAADQCRRAHALRMRARSVCDGQVHPCGGRDGVPGVRPGPLHQRDRSHAVPRLPGRNLLRKHRRFMYRVATLALPMHARR